MPPDPLRGQKNLSPHSMPGKGLGDADLPFFIPAGLTALQWEAVGAIDIFSHSAEKHKLIYKDYIGDGDPPLKR